MGRQYGHPGALTRSVILSNLADHVPNPAQFPTPLTTGSAAGTDSASGSTFLRPSFVLSVSCDLLIATATYFLASWLRFAGGRFEDFLPGTLSSLPLVVGAQIGTLLAVRAYASRPRMEWLVRLLLGIGIGTAIASAIVDVSLGFAGISRLAFVADAFLLCLVAVGWRGLWVIVSRGRAGRPAGEGDAELVDRVREMTTFEGGVLSLYRYRELLRNLVLKDLKLKYRGSIFGFLWSLANPLLMVVVYTIAFKYILQIRTPRFVFYLMLGQLSWTFFSSSAVMSTGSIVDNAGLIRSVRFPRAILPIATVLFNLAQYVLTVAVFLPLMMLVYHVMPSAPMLLFPVALALQVTFTMGVALILATVTTFFRDVKHLLEIALAVLFWTTPIIYEFHQVPDQLRLLILLSPASSFVLLYQKLFFYNQWPDAVVVSVAVVYAVTAFLTGAMLILAFEDRLTEQL